MARAKYVAVGVAIGIFVSLALVYTLPVNAPYRLECSSWYCLSEMGKLTGATYLDDYNLLYSVNASNTVLFVIAPEKNFTHQEINTLRFFLKNGGTLIVMDEYPTSNTLLSELGVRARIVPVAVADPVLNVGNIYAPCFTYENETGALNYAGYVECEKCVVLARTSDLSFADENLNRKVDRGEKLGPLTVAAKVAYGRGAVYVISDSDMFTNYLLKYNGNRKLLEDIVEGKKVLIDVAHRKLTLHDALKIAIGRVYAVVASRHVRYIVVALALLYIARRGVFHVGRS